MRQLVAVLCFVFAGGFFALPAVADNTTYTVTVMGEGTVSAIPDQVNLFVNIDSFSKGSQQAAMRRQAEKTEIVLSILGQAGVDTRDGGDVTTLNYRFGPKYEYDRTQKKNVLTGFVATQHLKIRTSLSAAGEVIDVISNHASVNQVSFVVSSRDELLEMAANLAIDDAQARAKRRAEKLGIELGVIVGFQEGNSFSPMPIMAKGISAMRVAVPQLPAGETEIRATVSVTYELIPQ